MMGLGYQSRDAVTSLAALEIAQVHLDVDLKTRIEVCYPKSCASSELLIGHLVLGVWGRMCQEFRSILAPKRAAQPLNSSIESCLELESPIPGSP